MSYSDSGSSSSGVGGSSMWQWAPIAINAIGSGISAIGGAGQARNQRRQQERNALRQERAGYAGMDQNERQYGYNANMQRGTILDNRAQAAVGLQDRLNRAPIADQAQYLIQQRLGMTPQAFEARDITRGGTGAIDGEAQGGPASQLARMSVASAAYRPGMGGVNTDAIQEAMTRFRDPSTLPGEYQTQSGGLMRFNAQRDELMGRLALEQDEGRRRTLQQQIAALDAIIASEMMRARTGAAGGAP